MTSCCHRGDDVQSEKEHLIKVGRKNSKGIKDQGHRGRQQRSKIVETLVQDYLNKAKKGRACRMQITIW